MRSLQSSTDASGPVQPRQVSVEILVNLVYLADALRRIPSEANTSIRRPNY